MTIPYLVFDIETVPHIELLRKMYHCTPTDAPQRVLDTALQAMTKKSGKPTDFVPAALQKPVTIGFLQADEHLAITKMGVYDHRRYQPSVATAAFWADVAATKELVHFNGRAFDLPVLELQAYEDGLVMPAWYNRSCANYLQPRNRYYNGATDLYNIYANDGAHGMAGGLNNMAKRIGCPGKMDTDGSQVWSMYLAGQIDQIAGYCLCDVLDTYWVFVRYAVQSGKIYSSREAELRKAFKTLKPGNQAVAEYVRLFVA